MQWQANCGNRLIQTDITPILKNGSVFPRRTVWETLVKGVQNHYTKFSGVRAPKWLRNTALVYTYCAYSTYIYT